MNSLELARKMEHDAISFYTEAANRTGAAVGKKMFETIAEDERHHLEMIEQVIRGLQITHADVHALGNVKTVFEGMRSEMMQRVEATRDEMEAFKIAMQMEKEGVDPYKTILTDTTTDRERALLNRLIEQEERHYDIFSNTYQFLADTGNWFLWEELGILEGG